MSPETQLDTDTVYDGRIIRVRVDSVGLPGGRETVREVVEHAACVVIVPVDSNGDILMVRQYRYATGRSLLEAPAGRVEPGESPDDCAQRELQEEVGYAAGSLLSLGGFWMSPGFCTEYMHAYLAQDLAPSRMEPDDDEDISVERIPLDNAPQLVQRGDIQDAKTIAALSMASAQMAG